jgi:hypothetical protein
MELDKEIIESFQEETSTLLNDLREIVEELEEVQDDFPTQKLEAFAQKIDRIMGTAQTFETMAPEHQVFKHMARFGELCKATGYKAISINHPPIIPIFAAFWGDTLDVMEDLADNVGEPDKIQQVTQKYIPVLQKRLTWLAGQIVDLTKKSPGKGNMSQINVDSLLKGFGIDVT